MRIILGAVLLGFLSIGAGHRAEAAGIALTRADGSSFDTPGEAGGNAAGFVASWIRTRTDGTPVISFRARQFSATGVAVGKELVFDRQSTALFDPIAISTGTAKVAGFWIRGVDGLVGRLGDTTTGQMGQEKIVFSDRADRLAEANADVVPLSGGRFAVVTYKFDFSAGFNKRIAVTILGSNLARVAGPTFVPGPGASYVATAASDFTAVGTSNGGALVVYRNRADGNVYAVRVTSGGAVAATAIKINAAAIPLGVAGQQVEFEVEAARLSDGRVLVAWTRIGSTEADDAFDIRYRILSSTGLPQGTERQAHSSASEEQLSPEILPLSSGTFEIAWTNNGGPVAGRPRSYRVRRFKSDGAPAASAKTVFTGERAFNGQALELAKAGTKLMLIHGKGSAPVTLEGFLTTP